MNVALNTSHFLTHGHFDRVAMSYGWCYLICIRFCAAIAVVENPLACFVRLDIQNMF